MINWSYFVNPTVNTGSEGAAILAPVTGVCREEESCLQLAESENVVFNVLFRGRSHTWQIYSRSGTAYLSGVNR